jgi:heparanase 1
VQLHSRAALIFAPLLLSAGIPFHAGPPLAAAAPQRLRADAAFDGSRVVATVDERFVSFAVDTAQVVGGRFWAPAGAGEGLLKTGAVPAFAFSRPRLRRLTGALAPAYLRIGGTDADRTVYDLGPPHSDGDGDGGGADRGRAAEASAAGARWVLTRQRWDAVSDFARQLDLRILFTLNAGPAARDAEGGWDPAGARQLVAYAVAHGDPVDVWELGNEANAFPVTHGLWLSPARYAADLGRARALLDQLAPHARLGGPATSYWPVVGAWRPFDGDVLTRAGRLLDVVSWHYYPQQSFRCPVATRRAQAGRMLPVEALADFDAWADAVEGAAAAGAPGAEVWLGETASAQCGGEPGFSNAFADALWWADTLGRAARRGQQVVVRQTLAGSDYGLIDDATLEPNPSYWASWLWRRLMGTRVLGAAARDDAPAALRAYYHCARPDAPGARAGAVTALYVNVGGATTVQVALRGAATDDARVFQLTAPGLGARRGDLNGTPLAAAADGAPPDLDALAAPLDAGAPITLPPSSITFVVLPAADAPACR